MLLLKMINAAPATSVASVNASSASGHASGESMTSWNIETTEDMNRIPKADPRSRANLELLGTVALTPVTFFRMGVLACGRHPAGSVDIRQGVTGGRGANDEEFQKGSRHADHRLPPLRFIQQLQSGRPHPRTGTPSRDA